MHPLERIEGWIASLKVAGQWREPVTEAEVSTNGQGEISGAAATIDARSNDYLGLAGAGVSRETTPDGSSRLQLGAGASRLISGTYPEHLAFEADLADWLGFEAGLLFSSAYAANTGTIAALARPGDTIFSDALNHASIIDGCRLSRAEVVVVPHGDLQALEIGLQRHALQRANSWVISESYFGMDGSVPKLRELRTLCNRAGAGLIIDEAHAVGVFGPRGRGLCAEAEVKADVLIGGLGKAFGMWGGFVASSATVRAWLWNRARPFVFSTAPGPAFAAEARERLAAIAAAEGQRSRLRAHEQLLRDRLLGAGISMPAGHRGPVFPIVLGDESSTLTAAERLRGLGIRCHPIRPPTVPRGTSRLRVSLRADMQTEEVETLAAALIAVCGGRRGVGPRVVSVAGEAPRADGSAGAWGEVRGAPEAASCAAEVADECDSREAEGGVEPGRARTRESRQEPSASTRIVGAASAVAFLETPRPGTSPDRAQARFANGLPRRWVVLGSGTDVGKTFVAAGLVRAIAGLGRTVAGLKPIETGVTAGAQSDAATLQQSSFHVKHPCPHPLYGFRDPVTPALAARSAGVTIDPGAIERWIDGVQPTEGNAAPVLVIETAGGVFSPLGPRLTNFDLARRLDPALWLLVAPDRLGVLHDVISSVRAMRAAARPPDCIVLSAPAEGDASTGTNRAELEAYGLGIPVLSVPRNSTAPLDGLLAEVRAARTDPVAPSGQ